MIFLTIPKNWTQIKPKRVEIIRDRIKKRFFLSEHSRIWQRIVGNLAIKRVFSFEKCLNREKKIEIMMKK